MKDLLNLRKDREVGVALSDIFSFIGQSGKPFGKILLYLVAPFYLLSSLASGWGQYQIVNSVGDISTMIDPDDIFEIYASLPWFSIGLGMLLQVLASAVMTSCIFLFIRTYEKNFHNEANGLEKAKEITVKDISSELWGHVAWVFGFTLIWLMMLFIASMFFFIPGIFLGTATSLLFAVYFIEQKGFSESMSRSMELVRNNWWRTFGFWVLLFAVFWVFNLIISLPITIMGGEEALLGATGITAIIVVIIQTITIFISSMLYVVFTVGSAIWYYSLVEKKEAVSLEHKIGSIGGKYNEDMFR